MENKEDIILQIRGLKISFKQDNADDIYVIRDVDLELKRRKTLAIVGESGSGKSVMVKSILGIIAGNERIDGGEILFNDEKTGETIDLLKLKKKEMINRICGQKVAMVFQDPMTALNPTQTIGNQVMEGMRKHLHLKKKEAWDKATEMLAKVGITQPDICMKQYPHQLSGGMRQRVVIAIALACNPDILICDEPTTALDVTIQAKILELIQNLQKEFGISVIYITHDLGVVAKVADDVAVMYAGKIVEYGRSEEVFYTPAHPYTWGLLSAIPDINSTDERLYAIPGMPPDLSKEIVGDAFAPRNEYALKIDYEVQPPMFQISDTHFAASWLLHPEAPKVNRPEHLQNRINLMIANYKQKLGSWVGEGEYV